MKKIPTLILQALHRKQGLRRIIAERKRRSRFRLRKVTFKGQGLQPHLARASWEYIRELSYEGRGG